MFNAIGRQEVAECLPEITPRTFQPHPRRWHFRRLPPSEASVRRFPVSSPKFSPGLTKEFPIRFRREFRANHLEDGLFSAGKWSMIPLDLQNSRYFP
jgi:hypothetical protein